MGSSPAEGRHQSLFVHLFEKADVDRKRMRRSSRYPQLLEPLALLLLITTCSSFRSFSRTHSFITPQKPESADSEAARWASQLKSSSEEERREAAMQLSLLKSD